MAKVINAPRTTDVDAQVEARVLAHQTNALIIDGLSGNLVNPEPGPVDGKSYPDRVLEAGINVVHITLAAHADTFDEILAVMYHYFDLFDDRSDIAMQVERVEEITKAQREKKIGVIFGSQTGNIVGRDMSRWAILHKLGLRVCQITYNQRNELGDGCYEPENRGLTAFGRQSVQEMNRLGIVVDLSHVGERTALDATAHSTKPVIYSHSNAKALTPSKRNITDEQMKAMAATGGIMGISSFTMMSYKTLGVRPNLDDYVNHVDYAVNLIGSDHVAIGSDLFESKTKLSWEASTKRATQSPFTYESKDTEGFSLMSDMPNVIRGLIRRGYSDSDVDKILGGNLLRVFSQAWRD